MKTFQNVMPPRPALAALCAAVLVLIGPAGASWAVTGDEVMTIPGGPEVVLQLDPESDVFCLAVAVEAGSAWESPEMRGVTHLLEHLCFDGSERYTREEISSWVDDRGAFLNAFTRKETTVYFMLAGEQYLEEGMEILSEMLLHSVFPPGELEKERKVVLEEIQHSMDSPGEVRSRFVDRFLYRGSTLTEPVIGYPSTIETMGRDDIVAYYRERYRPDRMKVLLMGDFDPRTAIGWISDYFPAWKGGGERRAKEPAGERELRRKAGIPRWSCELTRRKAGPMAPGIDVLVPVPHVYGKDFGAVLVMEELLQAGGDPLSAALAEASLPEPSIGLETHDGFSALRFHVDAPAEGKADLSAVPGMIAALASWRPAHEAVEAAKTAFISNEALSREKYHFYIMLSGGRFGLFGGRYMEASTDMVRKVRPKDVEGLLASCFDQVLFNALMLEPGTGTMEPPEDRLPAARSLPNGCRIAALTRTGSEIGAVHIMILGRSCAERGYLPGMSVLLGAVLEGSESGRALEEKLRAMGVSISYGDNPYIPMDDYYIGRAWSFVRLEGPAAAILEAARLTAAHMAGCPVTAGDVAALGRSLAGELAVRASSSSAALGDAVLSRLYPGHPISAPIFPKMRDIARVEPGTVSAFRDESFTGNNLIVTIVSPLGGDEALGGLDEIFSTLPAGDAWDCGPLPDTLLAGLYEQESPKQGVYMAEAWRIDDPSPRTAAAVMVASEILSRRMQLSIREKEGLAYSTGCGARPMPGTIAVEATLGTRKENLDRAAAALHEAVAGMSAEPPGAEETATARRRLLARLERRGLSSINAAFAAGLDILLREGHGSRALIGSVTDEEVAEAVSKVFLSGSACTVRLIPSEDAPEKKSAPPGMMGR